MQSDDTQKQTFDDEKIKQAYGYLVDLAKLNVKFAEVIRAPRYPSGRRESDIEHSFHLALSATELAANYYPELDIGLVSQFSFVHDLPETYSGDVWTFNISDEERSKKELAEKQAIERLIQELPPHNAQLLTRYEKQIEPEARFVRFVDKLLPDLIHTLACEASTFKDDHGITDPEEMRRIRAIRAVQLQQMFPEFPLIHNIRDLIIDDLHECLFSKTVNAS